MLFCLRTIAKKKWHLQPYEGKPGAYQLQLVYMTDLVVTYGRLFSDQRGWNLPGKLVKRTSEMERTLHSKMMRMRNKICAHSDADATRFSDFLMASGRSFVAVGTPSVSINAEETLVLQTMLRRWDAELADQHFALRRKISAALSPEVAAG